METTRLETYHPPEETLAALHGEPRLLCLGGMTSRHVLVSTDFVEEAPETLDEHTLWRERPVTTWCPSRVILASYSDFARDGGARSRAFFLRSGWVWDQTTREVHHFTRTPAQTPLHPPRAPFVADAKRPVILSEASVQSEASVILSKASVILSKASVILSKAKDLPAAPPPYLTLARRAVEDIKAGRFYQINLLRFFRAAPPDARSLIALWAQRAGEMGVFLRAPDLDLVSFSPERLVSLTSTDDTLTACAEPIKGTVAVGDDPREREAARELLASARKERAELAIITDLLRNDLFRIAQRHGVRVVERGAPVSAAGVEHFKSVITATCPRDLTFGALCRALLPGGSITGAPKLEVMTAIREYEGRPRDFFMGSVFVMGEEGGCLDASILIRTLVRHAGRDWEYAAGSGLTIASDPAAEAAEILAKCRVVTES